MKTRGRLRDSARTVGLLLAQIVGILAGVAICYLAFLMVDHQFLKETFANSIVDGVPGSIIPLLLAMAVFGAGLGAC